MVGGIVSFLDDRLPGLVLTYLSMPGELAAERVAERVGPAYRFATTRTPEVGWLTIHPLDAPRQRHRFGYEQPVSASPEIEASEVELVLLPGLCFDRQGGRIGWGKGYYDQLLSRLRPDTVTIGVTLERRIVVEVPMEPHDRRVDHLATEVGVVAVRQLGDR